MDGRSRQATTSNHVKDDQIMVRGGPRRHQHHRRRDPEKWKSFRVSFQNDHGAKNYGIRDATETHFRQAPDYFIMSFKSIETSIMYGVTIKVPHDTEWKETLKRLKKFDPAADARDRPGRILAGGQDGSTLFPGPDSYDDEIAPASKKAIDKLLGPGHGLEIRLEFLAPDCVVYGGEFDPNVYFEKHLKLFVVHAPSAIKNEFDSEMRVRNGIFTKPYVSPQIDTEAIGKSIGVVMYAFGLEPTTEIGWMQTTKSYSCEM